MERKESIHVRVLADDNEVPRLVVTDEVSVVTAEMDESPADAFQSGG